jgi:DNA mismatch repair protein MutS
LFATTPEPPELTLHPAVEALDSVDPDDLSPKAALELVYRLKKMTR